MAPNLLTENQLADRQLIDSHMEMRDLTTVDPTTPMSMSRRRKIIDEMSVGQMVFDQKFGAKFIAFLWKNCGLFNYDNKNGIDIF
jgi:hypothetical protein